MFSKLRPLLKFLPVISLIILSERLFVFIGHSAEMLGYAWQVDYDEGVILHSSLLLADGHNPYPVADPNHFISSVYPPLFYMLNALAIKIWGLNLWSGRGLSLFGTLLAAGALILWIFYERRSWSGGIIAAVLWLSLGPTIVWATFYKQDILAIAFGLLGGAMVASIKQRDTYKQVGKVKLPWQVWFAIVPFFLAFWTKQSSLAALVATIVFLLLYDWRSGLRWTLVALSLLVGSFVVVNTFLNGQLYYHLFMPDAETLTFAHLTKNMRALWVEHWPIILVAVATLIYFIVVVIMRKDRPQLSVWYLLASVPATMLTNMSPFANYNHLLPLLLPICLLVGVGVGELQKNLIKEQKIQLIYLTALIALTCGLIYQVSLFTPLYHWYTPLGQSQTAQGIRFVGLASALEKTPGRVLTEDDWLAIKAGKTLAFDDPTMLTTQANKGRWDENLLLGMIERHEFSLIVFEYDITNVDVTTRWTPELLAAIKDNYTVEFKDVNFIYQPKEFPTVTAKPLNCLISGGPTLQGYLLPGNGTLLSAGDAQPLMLHWTPGNSATKIDPNLKYTVQLHNPSGGVSWQADLPFGATTGQTWPNWKAGLLNVPDNLMVKIPSDSVNGLYNLTIGVYSGQGSQLLPLPFKCAEGGSLPSITLGSLNVDSAWKN